MKKTDTDRNAGVCFLLSVVVLGGFVYTVVNREYSVMYCKSII